MKILKKILKYCLMIFIIIIMLFGLKMIMPVSYENNNSVNKNIVNTKEA